jgi:RNA polymerase sigma-70 factor (ECF subfamily)
VNQHQDLADRFEEHRNYVHGVAYKLLGSHSDADDAVQEAWLRLSRVDAENIANLRAWLTTVTGRVCLDLLRKRRAHREEPLELRLPFQETNAPTHPHPEDEAILADSIGLALYVILETLTPAERVAFVLHDLFAVPFDSIAAVLGRSADATKMLASRARHRIRVSDSVGDLPRRAEREVVDAFFTAARSGDFDALVILLAPDIEMRADGPTTSDLVRGPAAVASRALMFALPDARVHPALVNGCAGVVVLVGGRPVSAMAFTIDGGLVKAIHSIADPDQLGRIVPSWIG